MAHPHISPPTRLLSLHASQHGGYVAFAPWRVPRVKAVAIVPVSDIDSFVTCNGVRINHRRGVNAMLPLLLHLGVHDQQRIVW